MSHEGRGKETGSRYRGLDRRGLAPSPPSSGSLAAVLVLLLVVTAAIGLAAAGVDIPQSRDRIAAGYWLTAATAVIAGIAGALYAMRWRLVGTAPALWIAAALLLYGAGSIAVPGLTGTFADTTGAASSWTAVVRPVSVLVVLVLVAVAALSAQIDARVTPRRVAALACGLAAVAAPLAWRWAGLRSLLGTDLDDTPATQPIALGQAGVAAVMALLAALVLHRCLRGGLTISPLIGAMLLGLAEGRLAWGVSMTAGPSWLLASQLLRLLAVGAALAGAARDLNAAFAQQQAQLLDSVLELQMADARRRAAEASQQERTHDVRAALCGIAGAAVTLERYHDQLDPDERSSLAGALSSEIARLQHIVAPPAAEEPSAFTVGEVIAPVARVVANRGVDVQVDVPIGLRAVGRPAAVAEVVQNLLENARLHAPGSPIVVRAAARELHVAVHVEDRGPGLTGDARHHAFERGWRGETEASGSGLGLFVAARLAREQGGDLRVDDRPGGGSSFVLTLPAVEQEAIVR